MKSTHIAAMLLGSAFLAYAASPATTAAAAKEADQPRAVRYLRDIRADAAQIQSAAARLDELAASTGATWIEYDRQWNLIDPAVEDMQIKLTRLESMQSRLSAAERADLDRSKPLVGEIRGRTHQFLTLLDTPGVQTSDAKFKTYASSIKNDAGKLEKLVPAS
jgi:hypothetical protein